ncbi:hypothetical protein [Swaminathania salitolerans]|uniref:Uncharacterized protein n=1 Tax=Swaminathania salitolerans TaxID=182838 RepID=A0A511BKH1_9PROT|nr:hypothetical protein [Swaminathania salitolerans]GEL00856.1 hypothetical protein SSA02_00190 [Swaminathania salitolerans]
MQQHHLDPYMDRRPQHLPDMPKPFAAPSAPEHPGMDIALLVSIEPMTVRIDDPQLGVLDLASPALRRGNLVIADLPRLV